MAEEIVIKSNDKEARYKELLPQVKALLENEKDLIANLANMAAALKYAMNFFWVGFYLVKKEELVLGPFQGPIACTRISKGKGVCGTAWKKNQVLVVPNVEEFPGHISCNALSKSEIVLPFYNKQKELVGVLDVDSHELNAFDNTDANYLNQLLELLDSE